MSESASPKVDLEKMSARIFNLIAKADATDFPEEAATYREKAEELMRLFNIEQEGLIAVDATSALPIVRKIVITNRRTTEFYQKHHSLWYWTADHCGILSEPRYQMNGDLVVTVVGYDMDIRYAETLYQSAWLMMGAKLEPKYDPRESDPENIYRLRSSGMARNRIAMLLWGEDTHAAHARVGKLYAMACVERGEDPIVAGRGINKDVYRESYAESFVSRYQNRLKASRDAVDSIAGLPILKGRFERVQERFWQEYPDQHPDRVRERREAAAKAAAEREGDEKKAVKPRAWTKADQARYERRYLSSAADAGTSAGSVAADMVEIRRGHEKAQRVEPGAARPSNGIALGN